MDNALNAVNIDVNWYDGAAGFSQQTRDILDAYNAVHLARTTMPAYTHASLDTALRHISTALNGDTIDERLMWMRNAADAVRRADASLKVRCDEYREMAL